MCSNLDGQMDVFKAAAIQEQGMIRSPKHGGHLVHNAALHPSIIVFGKLTYMCHRNPVQAELEDLVQPEDYSILKCC